MSACPLQTVLSDFEDASKHLEDDAKDVKREIQLVADSLRLGGAILGEKLKLLSKIGDSNRNYVKNCYNYEKLNYRRSSVNYTLLLPFQRVDIFDSQFLQQITKSLWNSSNCL